MRECPWHARDMSDPVNTVWLSVPEVCERLGVSPGKVHRLVEERALLGQKIDGVFHIPEAFLDGDHPHGDVRGTATVLLDGGFSPEGAIEWFLTLDAALGDTPIGAIVAGRKTEVRRLAQTLAI